MMATQAHINVRNNVQYSIPEASHSLAPESQSSSASSSMVEVETSFTQHHHNQPNEPFTTAATTPSSNEDSTNKNGNTITSSSSPMPQAWTLGATDDFTPLHQTGVTHTTNTSATTTPTNNDASTTASPPSPKKSTRRIKSLNNTKSEGFISLPPFPSPTLTPKTPTHPTPPSTNPYQTRLLNQPSTAVESILRTACATLAFDLAEVWLRTGRKTHQLVNSYLRPSALEESVRNELVDIYYGEASATKIHRLSPVLCKKAKEARDVVWVTSDTEKGVDALRVSISDVRTAVAVPVCHVGSGTNVTFIYFSLKRAIMKSPAVEFLVHMSLAAAVSSVNSISNDIFAGQHSIRRISRSGGSSSKENSPNDVTMPPNPPPEANLPREPSLTVDHLGLKWSSLRNVEYLTDGGNSWIHTAVLNGKPVVVKTLKPECQDLAVAINEIEAEYEIHSRLNHPNIVSLMGAGTTSKGVRFVVMERLDGGTMSQVLGYETRVRDRRRRFWKRKQFTHSEVLVHARALADALGYCHGRAIPNCMCLHRDLKPDNIGFTLDGTLKIIDFGLARILENSSPGSDEVYQMSGETGSLRYMAPEVAESRPYNHKADVYSFGIILWELISCKKPYDGMNRSRFYREVVHNNVRPPLNKKWPKDLCTLIGECWSADIEVRPSFDDVVLRLDGMLQTVKGAEKRRPKVLKMIDRHSMWF